MAVQQHVLNWLYSVLTSEYQDVNRTYNDVSQALAHFPTLSPRTDVHTFPNGASALLLHLSGTLPAVFRGATYRYPVSLWVPHNYPRDAPLVYVTPTETMMVRPGQHVDPQGQVYHPYLAGWAEYWDKSTIVDFLTILRDVFAKEPPVIARPAPRAPPSLPPHPAARGTNDAVAAAASPPPVPLPPQELATSPPPRRPQQQQPPPPPPKGSSASAQQLAQRPSPPPVPPHPSASPPAAGYRGSWYGASPPPPPPPSLPAQAGSTTGPPAPAAATTGGAAPPPVPGRPPYQQSPLGQPPLSPSSRQPAYPPPPSASATTTTASPLPAAAGFPSEYPSYSQPPPAPLQQPPLQSSPPPHVQQQQQPWQYPPYHHQQQQQLPYQPQPQPQPRPRQPPPPDLMDEPLASSSTSTSLPASGTAPGTGPGTAPGSGPPSSGTPAPAPPPVPPNPEKDALLHQLARALAAQRQASRQQDAASLAGLQAQRAALLAAAGRLQQDLSEVAQLSALLTSNTAILHESLAAADRVVASSQQTPAPAVDDLLVGPTVVAHQLYDLVAEERALADAVFMLGRAVERGRITPAVFAKMTRSLAREWYLKKALVRKVARGMGLASP